MKEPIFHLANPADVESMRHSGAYSSSSLTSEGFIHCCTAGQLPGVIQRYYIDATALVLLHIDAEVLENRLVYENTVGGTELFPHIYGEINAIAIIDTLLIDQTKIAQIAVSERYQHQL